MADLWACSANAPGRVKTQHGVIGEGQRRPFWCEEDVLRAVRHVAHFGWSTTTCKYSRTRSHKIQQNLIKTWFDFIFIVILNVPSCILGPCVKGFFSLTFMLCILMNNKDLFHRLVNDTIFLLFRFYRKHFWNKFASPKCFRDHIQRIHLHPWTNVSHNILGQVLKSPPKKHQVLYNILFHLATLALAYHY